ncbi:hypothetical protein BpHYR1_035746 [Brachionus plicatilis]|uniref:Uncharacterized protein n=1 Tax=Brachionus plicatilis TaxID=10195 RepID=A0A3M7SSM2_BRAPC|nr:hypothetical protein BpHYR1_035746 [Brachionus plicatilis]
MLWLNPTRYKPSSLCVYYLTRRLFFSDRNPPIVSCIVRSLCGNMLPDISPCLSNFSNDVSDVNWLLLLFLHHKLSVCSILSLEVVVGFTRGRTFPGF